MEPRNLTEALKTNETILAEFRRKLKDILPEHRQRCAAVLKVAQESARQLILSRYPKKSKRKSA